MDMGVWRGNHQDSICSGVIVGKLVMKDRELPVRDIAKMSRRVTESDKIQKFVLPLNVLAISGTIRTLRAVLVHRATVNLETFTDRHNAIVMMTARTILSAHSSIVAKVRLLTSCNVLVTPFHVCQKLLGVTENR